MKLERDSGRVLNGEPQLLGRPEGELQWQADVCRVRPSRKSGFSACQVLWLIVGRSASRAAVRRTSSFMCKTHLRARACGRSRADPLLAQQTAALLPSFAYAKRLGERGRIGLGLGTSSIVKSVLHGTRSKTETGICFDCKESLAWNTL